VLTALTTGPVYVVAVRLLSAPGTWEDSWIKYTFVAAAAIGSGVWLSMATDGRLRRPGSAFLIAAAYTALAVASTLWSILPTYTLWRSLTYVGLLATAWALASLTSAGLMTFLLVFGGAGVALSVVMVVAFPGVGRDGSGLWRGIFNNPNSLGPVCALLVIALLATLLEARSVTARVVCAAAALAAVVPLLETGSQTAIGSLAVGLVGSALVVGLSELGRRGRPVLAIVLAVIIAAAVATVVVVAVPHLGPTSGLRLREEVWRNVWERIWLKPRGGYGFFTYWDTDASKSPRILARAGSAHNSALEATLGVGFAGFALVAGLALLALGRSARDAVVGPSSRTWAWLALTTFVVLSHLTESFVSWFSYMWVLLIVVAWGRPTAQRA
jgi:O-antigen ligase